MSVAANAPLFLGIDLGTSGVRACVVDDTGSEVAQFTRSTPAPTLAAGQSEQSAALWLVAVRACLTDICLRINPAHLYAIAVDGTSSTLLLCDDEGRPLTPALMYNDARALAQAQRIREIAPANCGAHGASSSLAKLLWLRETHPHYANAHACHQADFVTAWLSGNPGIADANNCLKLGYDSVNQRWPDWLQALGVEHARLPQVVAPGSVINRMSAARAAEFAINPECLIVSGTTDSIAALIASGAHEVGDAVTSLGSTLVLKLISDTPVFNADYGIYSHRLGNHWLVGGASNTGGRVLRHYFSQSQLDAMTAQLHPEVSTGLNYYPLLCTGERFPVHDPHKLAVLEPRPDDDVKFFQGMLEAMARIEAEGYAKLQTLGASPLKRVLSAGGGSNNIAWCRMRARELGVPVTAATHTKASLGVALLAKQGWMTQHERNTTAGYKS